LAAYSLDALEPDEQALVLEHLAEGCEECNEEEAALRATSLLLALGAPALDAGDATVQPRSALRDRVLRETQRPTPISTHRGWRTHSGWRWNPLQALRSTSLNSSSMVAGVAGLAVAGLLAWAIVLQVQVDDLEGDNDALVSALTTTEERLSTAQVTAAEATANAIAAVFASSDASSVTRLSSPSGAAALGRMVQDTATGQFALVVDGLSPSESGTGYVLWAETPDGPKKIAHFYVDEAGTGIVHGYLDTGEAEGLRVTHEGEPEKADSPSPSVQLVSR
jgi:hypothetical protein